MSDLCRRCQAPMDGSSSDACAVGKTQGPHSHRPSEGDATVCDVYHCQFVEEINRRVAAGTLKILTQEQAIEQGIMRMATPEEMAQSVTYARTALLDGIISKDSHEHEVGGEG